jgi:uncharacterized protein (TIGR00369 family)
LSATEVLWWAPSVYQRHLGVVLALGSDRAEARLRVRPDMLAAPGRLRAGVLATLVDCAGGLTTLMTIEPGWTATIDLAVHQVSPFTHPDIAARARVVKRRRLGLVIAVDLVDGNGVTVGAAFASFADLENASDSGLGYATRNLEAVDAGERGTSIVRDDAMPPIDEQLGIATVHPNRVTVDVHEGVHNTAKALIGGATALLIDTAAARAATHAAGQPHWATGLDVRYLAPGRVGPVVADATVLGDSERPSAVRVEVFDSGADDRLMATALVPVAPVDPVD